MDNIIDLIYDYIMQKGARQGTPFAMKIISAMTIGVITLFLMGGLGFGLSGVYMWFDAILSKPMALMAFGGVLASVSMIIMIGVYMVYRMQKRMIWQAKEQTKLRIELALKEIDLFLQQNDTVQNNPKTAASVTAIAGYLMTENIDKVMRK